LNRPIAARAWLPGKPASRLGTTMYLRVSNWAAATAVSLSLAALAGCSGAEPDNAPPPPPPPSERAYVPAPADLAGAPPPARDSSGLAGGAPETRPAPVVVTMAPIPNPEDLPPAERRRIYGTAYDRSARGEEAPTQPMAAARPATIKPVPPRLPAVAVSPAGEKPVVRAPSPSAKAQPLDPKVAGLQAALGPQVSAGATLAIGPELSQRLAGPVALTLPPTLLDLIRQEAAKMGLGRAARVSEVSATLSGEGYEITPNGAQTSRLKSGEAAAFQWQVKPGAGELGPLRAQIDAVLRGQRDPIVVPLAAIEKTIAAPKAAEGVQRGLFNWGEVDVPGVGRMRWETVVGGGLLLLALLLLVAIARRASEAEARARRRRQKAAEQGQAEDAPHAADSPETAVEAPSEPKQP